jgi:hypothetical protein
MVVLQAIDGLDNATVNLTRTNNSSEAVGFYNLSYPLSCYHQVYVFHIEDDGSTGNVPFPREIDNSRASIHSVESCLPVKDIIISKH